MESRRGPQDEQVRREAQAEDNVIRLPRDWLGPPEELVPIGRGPEVPRTPQPEDFWSEASATVQDAVPAPRPEAPRRSLPRALPFRTAAVLATGLLALAAAWFGLMPNTHPGLRAAGSSRAEGLAVVLPPTFYGQQHRSVTRAHVVHRRARTVTRSPHVSHSSTPPPATGEPVSYTPSSSATESPSSSSPAQDSAPVETTTTTTRTTARSASTQSTAAPGPHGPGAPFGPGHLG